MALLHHEQVECFHRDGFLVIEDVLDDCEIAAVRSEYEAILERAATRLLEAGIVSDTYSELSFEERYARLFSELDDVYVLFQHLDISLPLIEAMPSDATLHAGPAVFDHLLTNDKILDIAESILDTSELFSNPVQHSRLKAPANLLRAALLDSNVARTLWHQDEATLTEDAAATDMLTVWVAMTDATVLNGCLHAVEGSHTEALTPHHAGTNFSAAEIYIPEESINGGRIVALEVKRGGVVLLHKRTMHAAFDNNSDGTRWSFDLRYHPIGQRTGRAFFPGFVARSFERPDLVLTDAAMWAASWQDARDRLVNGEEISFHDRWETS